MCLFFIVNDHIVHLDEDALEAQLPQPHCGGYHSYHQRTVFQKHSMAKPKTNLNHHFPSLWNWSSLLEVPPWKWRFSLGAWRHFVTHSSVKGTINSHRSLPIWIWHHVWPELAEEARKIHAELAVWPLDGCESIGNFENQGFNLQGNLAQKWWFGVGSGWWVQRHRQNPIWEPLVNPAVDRMIAGLGCVERKKEPFSLDRSLWCVVVSFDIGTWPYMVRAPPERPEEFGFSYQAHAGEPSCEGQGG